MTLKGTLFGSPPVAGSNRVGSEVARAFFSSPWVAFRPRVTLKGTLFGSPPFVGSFRVGSEVALCCSGYLESPGRPREFRVLTVDLVTLTVRTGLKALSREFLLALV